MNSKLDKNQVERFSRQIVLKDIGASGQKKIIQSKVLIIGMGGLGCPVAEFLTRAGVGTLGIVDYDNVDLSNIHRQSLYNVSDIKKSKVLVAKKKLKKINSKINIICHKIKIDKNNLKKIIKEYDYIVDGSDNFETKFLINDTCKKLKKFLVTGAISKFNGHIFTFDFKDIKTPCIRSFFQEKKISDDILNCEYEGVLGTVAGIIGTIQANEILKKILNIGVNLNGYILILDLLNLNFRKVKLNKLKNV
jgi:molybdopterin/thiamine biosynthesis adenylyltransferase